MDKTKLSICLIAKNEENFIGNCIKSVLPISDEIIVLDTGSTDKTKEISKNLGAKVYETTWENDFSKVRNQSIKYASGEWILVIDADEIISKHTQENLLNYLNSENFDLKKDYIIGFKVTTSDKSGTFEKYRYSLFKNSSNIQFYGKICERLVSNNKEKLEKIVNPNFEIINNGYEREINHRNNYINLLNTQIENNSEYLYYFYYQLGNIYSKSGNYNKSSEAFEKSISLYLEHKLDTKELLYGNILIHFINNLIVNGRNFEKALDYSNKILQNFPNFPDALFYSGYCYLNLKDFDKAIDYFNKTLESLSSINLNKSYLGINSMGESLKFITLLELSRCYFITQNFDKEIEILIKAHNDNLKNDSINIHLFKSYLIKKDLSNAIKYYLEINQEISESQKEKAINISNLPKENKIYNEFIIIFLNEIRQSQTWSSEELTIIYNKIKELTDEINNEEKKELNNSLKSQISVCLIAKNEENFIENCIKSVLPISDEIIVLDTGSTDKTKEISENLGAKVYETTWENDFSKARNHSIKYASGEWILYLGADETLTEDTQNNLLEFINNQDKNQPLVFCFKVINPDSENNTVTTFYRQALFRNNFGIHFIRPVHEQLISDEKEIINVNCQNFSIYHYSKFKSKQELDSKMNNYKRILIDEINKNPNKTDNYYYFHHLGNSYIQTSEHHLALNAYLESYKLYNQSGLNKSSLAFGSILIKLISELVFYQKSYNKALIFIEELLEISPDFPDAHYYKGYCFEFQQKYEKAIECFNNTISLLNSEENNNKLGIISQELSLIPMSLLDLSICYFNLGEINKSNEVLEKAHDIYPDSNPILLHLIKNYLLEGDLKNSIKYYFKFKALSKEEINDLNRIISLNPENKEQKLFLYNLLNSIKNIQGWSQTDIYLINKKLKEISPKVSVCMIVKNEEEHLEQCLESVIKFAHEINILDTGSTDKTTLIARKYGKVFEAKWKNDFSKARNQSIKYASGDWVMTIDADEIVTKETQNNLLPFLMQYSNTEKPLLLGIQIIDPKPNSPIETTYFKHSLFQNNKGFEYTSEIHEHIHNTKTDDWIEIDNPLLSYLHKGYYKKSSIFIKKNDNYRNLLLESLKHSNIKKSYTYYHIANSYAEQKDFDEAIKYYNLSFDLSENEYSRDKRISFLSTLIKQMVFSYDIYKYSDKIINKFLELDSKTPFIWFIKGYCQSQIEDYKNALDSYEKALELINLLTDNNYKNLRNIIMLEYARAEYLLGNEDNSLTKLKDIYSKDNNFKPSLIHIIRILLLQNKLDEAIEYYFLYSYKNSNEINNLRYLASQPKEEVLYKSILVKLLIEISLSESLTLIEKDIIKNKINNISPKLSICITTDNSEKYIERCINSVIHLAFEILVMDNNSKDNTKEIIREYSQIKLFENENSSENISELKNDLIKKAKGEWILFLEPYEYLTDDSKLNLLPFLIEQPYKNIPIIFNTKTLEKFHLKSLHESDFKGNLFRNNFDINFVRPIHEHLNREGDLQIINCPIISIFNNDISNFYLIEKTENLIKTNPQEDNYYYYFKLGELYFKNNEMSKALEAYLKSYEVFNKLSFPKENSLYGNILTRIIRLKSDNNTESILKYIDELLIISPDFPDALYYLGKYYFENKNIEKAISLFENILLNITQKECNPLGIVSEELNIIVKIYNKLFYCYKSENQDFKSKNILEQAYSINSNNKETLKNLIQLYIEEYNLLDAANLYLKLKGNYSFKEKSEIESLSLYSSESKEYKDLKEEILDFIK